MARIALRLKDLGVLDIPLKDRETLDHLSQYLGEFRKSQNNSVLKYLLLLSPPIVRKKDENYELLTSHAKFVLTHSVLGDEMPITIVGDEVDAAMEEDLSSTSKLLDALLFQHLRNPRSWDDLPTSLVPNGLAEQPVELPPKKSRRADARRRRIAAGQICPVCLRKTGKEVPVNSPKNWKQYVAGNDMPFTLSPDPLLSCATCDFVLCVTNDELALYNAVDGRLSMSELLRQSERACPSCGGIAYDRLSRGIVREIVCEGRLRPEGERACDFSKTLAAPVADVSDAYDSR